MADKSDAAGRTLFLGAVLGFLALCVFQAVWAFKTKKALEDVQATLAKGGGDAERIEKLNRDLARVEDKLDKLAGDQGLVVDDISRLAKKMDALKTSFERRDRAGLTDVP